MTALLLVQTSRMGEADRRATLAPAAEGVEPLVERARAGDAAAFRALYAKHSRAVASQLAFLVPRSDLEDVLQDVFIEAYRSLKRFEGRSQFSTWLYRIAVHVASKARRTQARRRTDLVEEVPDVADPAAGPGDVSLSAERQARVEALLTQLAPKKRTVLVLHDLRGMSASRIAELLETNILTVRTRLFYARKEFEALAAKDPALSDFFEAPPKERAP
jgi:RNA polymerase sigma-70 factor (ECF subfamily)